MTLSENLGLAKAINNVRLRPEKKWLSKQDQDFTIRELQCSTCRAVLAVEVTEHPASVDLVWPHKVICLPAGGHVLMKRDKGEDANVICVGKGATLDEATEYLERIAQGEK